VVRPKAAVSSFPPRVGQSAANRDWPFCLYYPHYRLLDALQILINGLLPTVPGTSQYQASSGSVLHNIICVFLSILVLQSPTRSSHDDLEREIKLSTTHEAVVLDIAISDSPLATPNYLPCRVSDPSVPVANALSCPISRFPKYSMTRCQLSVNFQLESDGMKH